MSSVCSNKYVVAKSSFNGVVEIEARPSKLVDEFSSVHSN